MSCPLASFLFSLFHAPTLNKTSSFFASLVALAVWHCQFLRSTDSYLLEHSNTELSDQNLHIINKRRQANQQKEASRSCFEFLLSSNYLPSLTAQGAQTFSTGPHCQASTFLILEYLSKASKEGGQNTTLIEFTPLAKPAVLFPSLVDSHIIASFQQLL